MTSRAFYSTLKHIGTTTLAWIVAALLFSLVRLYGVEEELVYTRVAANRSIWQLILIQGLVAGTAFGIIFGLMERALKHKVFRKTSYAVIILIRLVGHLIFTLLISSLLFLISAKMSGQYEIDNVGKFILSSSFSKTAPVIIAYTAFVSILFGLIRQTDAMVGSGMLRNLLVGKYHHPKEEERIFMFLDLKSSTTYAERLGHILYSELIQDCFYDLTDALQEHEVEVYQYVGDEAVLTWHIPQGLKNGNCLGAFFTFEQTIQARADYYFNKYDLVPVFKAGGNMGLVMTAEVGVVKKEIAYHSDVLNTAARIQSCCNPLGHRLLISEYLYNQLPMLPDYKFEEVGAVSLKGKIQKVNIFSVEPTTPLEHKFEFSE